MGECIDEVWLPQCLAMGIPYETFLILNPKRIKPFAKAFKQKQDEKLESINLTAWINGMYIANAIGSCFAKNVKYPDKPFDLTAKEEITDNPVINIDAIRFSAFAKIFNQNFVQSHSEEIVDKENN